jgi:hypothetical protein
MRARIKRFAKWTAGLGGGAIGAIALLLCLRPFVDANYASSGQYYGVVAMTDGSARPCTGVIAKFDTGLVLLTSDHCKVYTPVLSHTRYWGDGSEVRVGPWLDIQSKLAYTRVCDLGGASNFPTLEAESQAVGNVLPKGNDFRVVGWDITPADEPSVLGWLWKLWREHGFEAYKGEGLSRTNDLEWNPLLVTPGSLNGTTRCDVDSRLEKADCGAPLFNEMGHVASIMEDLHGATANGVNEGGLFLLAPFVKKWIDHHPPPACGPRPAIGDSRN